MALYLRQCTYNITLRHIHTTTVALEEQSALHNLSVCALRHPACKTRAPYCHLWPAWLYKIFLHDLINDMIF